jgi:hypothetical protein
MPRDAHVLPTLPTDAVPPVDVAGELRTVELMNPAVVLGAYTPARKRQIQLGHRHPVLVAQDPVDLRLRKPGGCVRQSGVSVAR